MMNFEFAILDFIQSIRFGLLDSFMVFITTIGDAGIFWIVTALVLIAFKKTRKLGVACLISVAFSGLFTNVILKNAIGRERPYMFKEVAMLIDAQPDYSFPSGHTSAAFSVAYVLLKEKFMIGNVKIYILAIILASLMAFSRMYLYVHFPTDIIGSLIISYLYAMAAILITKKIFKTDSLQEL
ncbi:phosphatase PAP2 family protein [Acidaminobacter sp. JC074]|uniref:phosphatase PAP2 family protein n=1 Tax=Acidaminobacter sp. JC074 TaxID=2530199 RepID=UPI001F0CE1E7|nr:phosphatase PAP2 family protein [Acidaminobacter sp. JC074]MCH4887269.1 phosphatase PAP2 family protein [Acidaminobacter sp. JC074]